MPQIDQYTPTIHEAFRRHGFPIERAGKVHQVTFTPSATTPVQLTERQRWDYRNKDETWSILLTRDTVILQTTAHTRFEDFAERLRMAVHTVLAESEHDRLGVVHRVGLRYIDVVRASGGKDFRFYLRPGLHGVPDEVFQPGQHLLHTECRGRTVVGGNPGTMVVRIVQSVCARRLGASTGRWGSTGGRHTRNGRGGGRRSLGGRTRQRRGIVQADADD